MLQETACGSLVHHAHLLGKVCLVLTDSALPNLHSLQNTNTAAAQQTRRKRVSRTTSPV
jgi:hypothetical protein